MWYSPPSTNPGHSPSWIRTESMDSFNTVNNVEADIKREIPITFNNMPIIDVHPEDVNLVQNVAKIMLTIKYPQLQPHDWQFDPLVDENCYFLRCDFQGLVKFSLKDLLLIDLVNQVRVKDVWVQPHEHSTSLCAYVWKRNSPFTITVTTITIQRAKAQLPNSYSESDLLLVNGKKRQKVDGSGQ